MFEHLDDPSPPEPTRSALASVLSRSARLRRRRARSTMAAVGTVGLLAGVVVGVAVSSSSPSQSFTAFTTSTGVLAPGTPVPGADLQDLVFPTDIEGFALVVHGAQTLLAQSTDAGSSWQVVNGNLPIASPAQLDFTDSSHGYLWGGRPSLDGAAPLWVSADGGATWAEAPLGPVVSDVVAIRSDVWAVVGSCFIGTSSSVGDCPVRVEVSSDYGRTWATTASAPGINESTAPTLSDQSTELARVSHAHAYVLSFRLNSPGTGATGQIAYTPDAGRTWETRPDPCPSYFDFGEQIAASSTDDLWLVCASQGSAGAQGKALYRSTDGGRSWTLTAAANAQVLTSNVSLPAGGGLPVGGYLAPYSLGHENMAILSSTTALLFPARSGVFETTDGGRTWHPVPSLALAGSSGAATGTVVFSDATHGWVSSLGVGLWRTTDGDTWTQVGSVPSS